MAAPRKYSDELRERVIRSVNETIRGPRHAGSGLRQGERAARQPTGAAADVIPRACAGQRGLSATATDPHERIVELEKENGGLRRANAILHVMSCRPRPR